jgi:hypothetical protein
MDDPDSDLGGPLDALADDIARPHLVGLRTWGPRHGRLRAVADRGGVVGTIAGAGLTAVEAGSTVVGLVRIARTAADVDPKGSYRQVTGCGLDRADADVMLVENRLSLLVAAAAVPGVVPPGDARELVGSAARRLVRWVAAARPRDAAMAATTRAYERLADAMRDAGRQHPAQARQSAQAPEDVQAAAGAYVEAWRATLGR